MTKIINKTKKEEKLLKLLKQNRTARLLRKQQAEKKRKFLMDGRLAEHRIMEKLKESLNKNHTLVDNNITNKFSIMDFTSIDSNTYPVTDYEHKYRIEYNHNHFYNGLMFGKNKYNYSLSRLQNGIRQLYYWTCADGIYFWELINPIQQQNEFSFGMNSNKQLNQSPQEMVYVKCKYLTKLK